ncbi:unnamed protein product, partial [Medioppia subpectinata]
MKSLSSKDSSAGLLVLAEGGNAGEAVIATREGHLDVKGASGFRLGSYTEVSINVIVPKPFIRDNPMDALPVIKTFKSLRPVMANERVKSRLRLLCVFGFNGSEIIFATDGPEDKVYGLGDNQCGCLGLGIDTRKLTVPKLNPHLTGKR